MEIEATNQNSNPCKHSLIALFLIVACISCKKEKNSEINPPIAPGQTCWTCIDSIKYYYPDGHHFTSLTYNTCDKDSMQMYEARHGDTTIYQSGGYWIHTQYETKCK